MGSAGDAVSVWPTGSRRRCAIVGEPDISEAVLLRSRHARVRMGRLLCGPAPRLTKPEAGPDLRDDAVGNNFIFWDAVFGTRYLPRPLRAPAVLGFDGAPRARW